ncbi:Cuticle protein 6 [Formica fusca]
MQALIPVFAILGVATSAQLTLLPYAYLANPLPVYHQSQDTRVGVHAYSYAGGPSAKEEVRGLDGVTRGSYSYIDAHGILQSVFYVADEGGFRVAATNLPLGTGEQVLLASNVLQEDAKVTAAEEVQRTTSRRKRSLEASTDNQDRTENPSSQEDRDSANASPKSSQELPAQEEKTEAGRINRGTTASVVAPVYELSDTILVPRLIGTATSPQSRVDVHNNVRLKAVQPVETIGVLSAPSYETVILPSQVPLAISHQSRLQVHDDLHVERPEKLVKDATQPETSAVAAIDLGPLPVLSALPDYNQNRIQLYKNLGLEGSNVKNAVKLDAVPLAIVETPIKSPVPAVPTVTKEVPVVTAVSSQSRTQIHGNTKLEVAVPIVSGPTVYVATSYAQPIAAWPILATPLAQASQYRSQIHLNEKRVW